MGTGCSLGWKKPLCERCDHRNISSWDGNELRNTLLRIGVGGIMIEDMLLITEDGVEMLSHLPRD